MVEQSLLTDELRALIGRTAPLGKSRVTTRALERATDTFFGHVPSSYPAPGEPVPGFVIAALETENDGVSDPTVPPDQLLVSNEWVFERQMRMGEEFEAHHRLADISERFGGRFGYSLYFRTEVEFREPGTNAIVVRSVTTLMQYDARNATDGDGS